MSLSSSRLVRAPVDDGLFRLSQNEFSEITKIVQRECGIHLPDSKFGLVVARLQKRILALKLGSFAEYIQYLKSKSGNLEFEEMISRITTNVTSFNRESHHFDHFKKHALPELIDSARRGESVRLWSAGCSDGREPYTLACALFDEFPEVANYDVRILATDIDKYSLAKARSGEYPRDQVSNLPSEVSERWFEKSGSNLKVNAKIAKIISFKQLNLMTSWPMKKKIDVIFCRNVMIYFSTDDQASLLRNFAKYLRPGRYLYIGHSERVHRSANALFRQVGITTYIRESGGEQL